jgi:hypothetical protein
MTINFSVAGANFTVRRVPRLIRQHPLAQQWLKGMESTTAWSPRTLLTTEDWFKADQIWTVKRSKSRFFMYEEHGHGHLQDEQRATEEITVTPAQLADLLHNKNTGDQHYYYYYYWTIPIASVAPELLRGMLGNYASLYSPEVDPNTLDPRGPSVWMGSTGSVTQAHYDVADNVLVQMHGRKRIRVWPPSCHANLHVFPDAHPRARKSQIMPIDNHNHPYHDNTTKQQQQERFPLLGNLSNPFLDVVLHPGDALEIPAFWFHHVENGKIVASSNNNSKKEEEEEQPTVSINLFCLSQPMRIAQQIFQRATSVLPVLRNHPTQNPSLELAAVALRALGWELVQGLEQQLEREHFGSTSRYNNVYESPYASPHEYIAVQLLQSRYGPLLGHEYFQDVLSAEKKEPRTATTTTSVTKEQTNAIQECVARILPDFEALQSLEHDPTSSSSDHDDHDEKNTDPNKNAPSDSHSKRENGIVDLVALHLLEFWAVQLVGAPKVADAWRAALLLQAPPPCSK